MFDQVIEVGVRIGISAIHRCVSISACSTRRAAKLHATGEIVWVYTDQTRTKTVRVPDRIRDAIASADPVA